MSAFEYQALTEEGRERQGVLEGDTARHVRQQLRDAGLTPLQVAEVSAGSGGSTRGPGFSIGAGDLALLTRQLATLAGSGLALEEALRTAAHQSDKRRIRNVLLGVRARVMEGHTLAQGLAAFPAVFPELYRATVAAGEESGRLESILERLADYTEARQQLRQKIQLALLYPVILTVAALAISAALLAYVVPEVIQVFDHIDQELPLLTVGLIAVSDGLRNWGLILGLGGLAVFIGWRLWLRQPGPRLAWDGVRLRIPLVGRLERGINTARFTRTFSILVASGVPALEATRIAAAVIGNRAMRDAVSGAAHRVREGTGLSTALDQSGCFPPMTLQLLASGEASGHLAELAERAARHQERELESSVGVLLGIFEPVLILLMGVMVLVIVMAILLPIFELNQLVQ